jgi:hypothetical protein
MRYLRAENSALRHPSLHAGEILLSDSCNQLSYTSTREPFDSRVEAFAFRHGQRSLRHHQVALQQLSLRWR